MIFAFETKRSKVLDEFLDRYENPVNLSNSLARLSFLEFKITRLDDLVIISQKHLYDVVAKWLLLCSVADLLISYVNGWSTLFYLGSVFLVVSILWLSKYARFFALKWKINGLGHKDKITLLSNDLIIDKLLLKVD